MKSIKSYLLTRLMTILFIVTIILTVTAYFGTMHEADELFDGHLKQIATALDKHDFPNSKLVLDPHKTYKTAIEDEEEFLIQIWEGEILQYSSYPGIPFPKLAKNGFDKTFYQDDKWRSYTIHDKNRTIQVAQPLKGRREMVEEIGFSMLLPILLQFPILGLFIWFAVRRGLRPLKSVSFAIHERTPSSLKPIDLTQIPYEIQPLVLALNNLLVRLGDALDIQKKFTADAAHELRTPLTAVQLQLGILMRAQNDTERKSAMSKLEKGIKRSIHLVQQLLTSARLEPNKPAAKETSVDLNGLVNSSIDQFQILAHDKHISLSMDQANKTISINGQQDDLQTLLNNLLDNAIRYTPNQGRVLVSIKQDDQNAILTVSDNGPGIPEEEHSRVFDRFYRIIGTKTSGTGLGLSIVKTIAEQHGATLMLDKGLDQKGLSVAIHFPLN